MKDNPGQGFALLSFFAMLLAYVYTSQTPRASIWYQILPLTLTGLFMCLRWWIRAPAYGIVVVVGSILVVAVSVTRYVKMKKQSFKD